MEAKMVVITSAVADFESVRSRWRAGRGSVWPDSHVIRSIRWDGTDC